MTGSYLYIYLNSAYTARAFVLALSISVEVTKNSRFICINCLFLCAINGPAHEILLLISYALNQYLIVHEQLHVSMGSR